MLPSIEDVKRRHETRLLQLPAVVSVGIGLNRDGQAAIIIGLAGSHAESESQLPAMLEGYPVELRIVGPLKAQ